MTLLGFRDTCYNDFNFDIDEKDFYLGTDTYKKIAKILKDAQNEQLLVQFEEGTHLYQDYDPEYLSVAQKREIQHDINAARNFLDNYDRDADDKHDNYAAYLDDNSLSYSFGPDSNLDEVQNNLNDIETNGVIIWQRRKDEYILLPHTIHSLERIKKQIASSKRVDDKKLRYAMERLFDNITDKDAEYIFELLPDKTFKNTITSNGIFGKTKTIIILKKIKELPQGYNMDINTLFPEPVIDDFSNK